MKHRFIRGAIGAFALFTSGTAFALNYFELEVYPYATASRGEVEVENFTTYTGRGRDDSSAPDNNTGLTRSTLEFTYGLTDRTEVAYYRDYQRARGGNFEHVAGRYRARTRFAEKGEWPVDVGLYAELEFPRGEGDDVEAELRGIVEKDFGRWTLDINPIFERVLSGPGHADGWELQYAAALIYRADERWQPRLDLFGDFGPIRHFESHNEQKHLLSPAIDLRLAHHLHAGLGVGLGLTDATEQRVGARSGRVGILTRMQVDPNTTGDKTIAAYLNGALANEVVAATQYFMHARLYKHFGRYRLSARAYQESIGEMKHADRLIERILYLDGTPNPQDLKKLLVGEEMLMRDRQLELNCITLLKEAIEYCGQQDDRVSRALLQDILRDEQEHADWLVAELDRMGRAEPEEYL